MKYLSSVLCLFFASGVALAQEAYPTRAITIVSPFPRGARRI